MQRGPENYTEGIAHALFLDARRQAVSYCCVPAHQQDTNLGQIITAIKQRKPCPLSSPEWMTVPWLNKPKDLRHELYDVMIQLPAILAQFDTAKSLRDNPVEMDSLRFEFFRACKELDEGIQNWLLKLAACVDPKLTEQVLNGIPESFELEDVAFALTMAIYWTMCTVFYRTLHLAFAHFKVSLASCGIEKRFDPEPYASNIARSVKYFFRPDAGMVSAQSFAFPMGIALNYFSSTNAETTPEHHLLVEGFTRGHTGYTIMKFLLSLQKDTAAQIVDDDDNDDGPERVARDTQYVVVRERAKTWFETST
jgi:hypothetical protein